MKKENCSLCGQLIYEPLLSEYKERIKELATQNNIRPIVGEVFQKVLSGYKQILLEGIDKLKEKMILSSPSAMRIYRIALDDVRQLIKTEKN